jgi:hypothetical protein
VGKTLGQASDAIPAVQAAITTAEELARKYGYQVGDTGQVTDTFAGREPPADMHPEDRAHAQRQVAADIEQALRTADDIDNDLESVLFRATLAEFGSGNDATVAAAAAAGLADPGLTLPEPPPNATPAQNAAWWATLSPAGQAILLHDHPDWIGKLDGLPAELRDTANRVVLDQKRTDLQHQRDDIQHRLDGLKRSDPRDMDEYHELEDQRAALDGKLKGMDSVSNRLKNRLPGQQPAYLLGINPDNAGQAIIAIGNPDHAANVATYVPGTFAGLDGIDTDINRADLMGLTARKVNPVPTSVIAWVGYDAPQSILPDAASTSFADHAETALHNFQDGLGVSHDPGPVNNTVIGHSYGTTVVGQTSRDLGLNADNVVMVASPGVGVDHADQLHLDGVPADQTSHHVYSTAAPTDPIPIVTNFRAPELDGVDPLGPDPTTDWFGGERFKSNATSPLTSHSDYWNAYSDSLRAMGNLIAGRPPS